MNSVDKALRGIEDWINVVTFVIMLTLTFANVFSRFVLHASLAFTDEFVTVLFVLCSLAGSSVGQRNRNHLGLDFFTSFLPEKAQRFLSFVANILALVFLAILFWHGCGMVKSEYVLKQVSTTMQYPQWIYGLTVPVGSMIMIVRYIIDSILKWHEFQNYGKEEK